MSQACLPFFRGSRKTTFDKLYRLSVPEAKALIKKINTDPQEYGTPAQYHGDLKRATALILKHSPAIAKTSKGNNWESTIFAQFDPSDQTWKPEPHSFRFRNQELSLYTVFDVLGWMLSILNPAPFGATYENFYQPALVFYVRLCGLVTGNIEKAPNTNHITVFQPPTQDDNLLLSSNTFNLALGSVIGPTSPLKEDVRLERIKLLEGLPGMHIPASHRAPSMTGSYAKIGHCCETYPLIIASRLRDEIQLPLVTGMAIRSRGVDFSLPYDHKEFQRWFMKPCGNCQYLITQLGLELNNFMVPRDGP